MKTPSVEPVLQSRLLPKVSFRFVMAVTAVFAVLGAVGRVAGEGGALALATLCGLAFPLICFALFGILFLISWGVSGLWYEADDDALKGSPFADGQLPPQLLPPREQKP